MKGSIRDTDERAWFEGMCKDPVLFHALSYKCGVHQTLRGLVPLQQKRLEILEHQLRTIQLINSALDELENANLEHLIIAMMCLWRTNPKRPQSKEAADPLFSAHIPDANWISLYGQMQNVDLHGKAITHLVDRLGGTQSLQFPGVLVAAFSL
jgi:hypothetical protein